MVYENRSNDSTHPCPGPQPEVGQSGNCPSPKFSQTYVYVRCNKLHHFAPQKNISWLRPCPCRSPTPTTNGCDLTPDTNFWVGIQWFGGQYQAAVNIALLQISPKLFPRNPMLIFLKVNKTCVYVFGTVGGVTRGGQSENNSPGAESLWGAEKSQQCHKYFL